MTDSGHRPKTTHPRPAGTSPTVAVAFGGGGARGFAHIHVIEVLDELGIRPVAIAGSSIGAIMGSAMAAGMPGREIRAYTLATLGNRSEVLSRFWRLRPESVRKMVSDGWRIGQLDAERVLRAFLPERLPHRFEDLAIPMKVIATDYYAHSEMVCEKGELFPALAASAAMPAIFHPVRLGGRMTIDGGIANPVPFDHLAGLADIVIAIDVVGAPAGDPARLPGRIDALIGATQLMMQSIIALKMERSRPDILLRPNLNRFRVLDFLKAGQVLEASTGIRDDLKRALDGILNEPG